MTPQSAIRSTSAARCDAPSARRGAVCVLGVHRSGTSLVARIVNLLGVDFGPDEHLLGASEFNTTGFWEHREIIEINDEILERFKMSWREPRPLPVGWHTAEQIADLRARAKELVAREFTGRGLWGWKDPRACLTLPFWERIVGPMSYVVCWRNPLEVARSLEHTLPLEEGMRLWLHYSTMMLQHVRDRRQLWVTYEDVLEEPLAAACQIGDFLDLDGWNDAGCREAIREFATAELRHHRTSTRELLEDPRTPLAVKSLYLMSRCDFDSDRGDDSNRRLEATFATMCLAEMESQGQAAARVGALENAIESRQETIARLHAEHGTREQEFARIQHRLAHRDSELAAANGRMAELVRENGEAYQQLARLTGKVESLADERQWLRQRTIDAARSMQQLVERLGALGAGSGAADLSDGQALSNGIPDAPDEAPPYAELATRLREVVGKKTAAGAHVLIVSKGDEELLAVAGRKVGHFPQAPDGGYAGHHPANGRDALDELRKALARGARYLVFPATSRWWFEHYPELAQYLIASAKVVANTAEGIVFDLLRQADSSSREPIANQRSNADDAKATTSGPLRLLIDSLLPPEAHLLVMGHDEESLAQLAGRRAELFPCRTSRSDTVAALDRWIRRGAEYLVIPAHLATDRELPPSLVRSLAERHDVITTQEHVGHIFALRRPTPARSKRNRSRTTNRRSAK